jgi:lipoprotein-releasing system ATP-binding protein
MSDAILESQGLCKSYQDGASQVEVLKGVDLRIAAGDRVAIIGPSGSGKSTLLHVLGGLDKASSGQVLINGIAWQQLQEKKRCQLRNKSLGFVYQFHHLLPEFTALENIALPLLLGQVSTDEACERASSMLDKVGLGLRKTHKPSQLSGGERQRVAIARALVHQPACLLADEPTGNLDQATAGKVFDLMLDLNASRQTALVIVTHDEKIAHRMDRVLVLQEGVLSA